MKKKNEMFLFFLTVFSSLILIILMFPIFNLIFTTTLEQYIAAFLDRDVMLAILTSLVSATITTLISLILGVPLAYILARVEFNGKKVLDSLLDLPLLLPHTVAGIALLGMFGRNSFFGHFFGYLGITFLDSLWGIVVAQFFVSSPLLVKSARDMFLKIDERYIKASRSLGASRLDTFLDIELPLSAKGIFTGSIMCWARALSEFGAVIILAYHPMTAPVIIYATFTSQGLTKSKPIAALLLLITFMIFFVLKVVEHKGEDSSA